MRLLESAIGTAPWEWWNLLLFPVSVERGTGIIRSRMEIDLSVLSQYSTRRYARPEAARYPRSTPQDR